MSEELNPVTVRILDKEYQVACTEDERLALLESAELLNSKMREIRAAGKVVGLDRIAVMAALNLSHEVLLIRNASTQVDQQMLERLRAMNERLNQAVGMDATAH
ncbi:MAG TPA: cell division protein ZapA [Gammaproteobacteria bacterium]|jgi:cell division protein ZapA|nr:cell division protein ZapA [Gammaproteobacteria bacterium]